MEKSELRRFVASLEGLPKNYPTHTHESCFWEYLGRAVASFGFLEEVLIKAIFAFTATKKHRKDEIKEAYLQWPSKLEKSLSDQLAGLIRAYGKAVRENPDATTEDLDDLLSRLRKASEMRNVLCHGSWRPPDQNGASVPFFVNRQNQRFERPVDVLFLKQVLKVTSELICEVISSVTYMGWQFPGSSGPGKVVWGK